MLATRPMAGALGGTAGGAEGAHKMFGIEYGIVSTKAVEQGEATGCPEIMVELPRLPPSKETSKPPVIPCRFASLIAGEKRGFYWTPEPGDEVVVAFERGEQNRGVIIGCLWNGKLPMPKPSLTTGEKPAWNEDNTTRMIVTNSGHKVVFEDKGGEEQIHIEDKSGKRWLTFDTVEKKIILTEDEGDLEIKVKKKISLECEEFVLKASKKINMETKEAKLKTSSKTEVEGGSKIKMKASRIDLNP